MRNAYDSSPNIWAPVRRFLWVLFPRVRDVLHGGLDTGTSPRLVQVAGIFSIASPITPPEYEHQIPSPVPWLVIIALLTIVVSAFILHGTVLGVHVYATGGNAQAARLTGIPVPFVLIFVYGVSGLLSGLGGVMSASRLYSAQGQLGIGYELDAIAPFSGP